MRNTSGILRFLAVCVISLAVIGSGIYKGVSSAFSGGDEAYFYEDEHYFEDSGDAETPKTASGSSTGDKSEAKSGSASVSDQSVPTGSGAVIKGNVVTRYISPYSANTSYNGTYLKNSTDANIDIKGLLSAALPYKIEKNDQPQVLILHTHTTETYMLEDRDYYTEGDVSRTQNSEYNMLKIGSVVAKKLNDAGIKTVQADTVHDYPEYNGSYGRAAATIQKYLKKYPGIKIVLDIHRDAISADENSKVKIVSEIGGKKAAQVMLVMGSQTGGVTNFPNWQENLKLALRFQQIMEVMYPTLARPLSLMSRNYNESLTTGSMLLEVGTDGNTVDEAIYAAEMAGTALASLLNTLK